MSHTPPWWQSSAFLGGVSAVTSALAVIAVVWAALYASRPRRALAYSAKVRVPTEQERATWITKVEPKEEQQRAVIITFRLRGSGRLDVPTSAFDNSTPITVTVRDAEIQSVGAVSTRGGGGLTPEYQFYKDRLEILPGLIGRNQVLTYTLIAVARTQLIPSGSARVTLTNALIDTKLRTDKSDLLMRLGAVVAMAALLFGLWYWWLRHISFHIGSVISVFALTTSIATLAWTIYTDLARPRQSAGLQRAAPPVRISIRKRPPDQEQPPDQ